MHLRLMVVVDGESVKRFKKERKVGEGGYAVVYEGRDRQTGRRVAIKKIKMTTHGAGLDISAIREVRVLTELRHPNIVEVCACGFEEQLFASFSSWWMCFPTAAT